MTLGKKEFEVEVCELNQADLKFYIENPRIYSIVNINGVEPSQEDIEEQLCNMDHVKQLKLSIESNGGLIDPLIVRNGDFTVLEGNSRLAAYRLLCSKDPIKWGKIKCKLLPENIDDAAIFALLGQYHIIGRKDWDPFEQANYLYRRQQNTRLPIEFMAQELGISKQKAKKMLEVIEFMIKSGDLNKRHWSHYEEYLKNPGIKKYRDTNPDIDDTIVASIKADEIKDAKDMRKLGEIAKISDKQSKKVMVKISKGEISIYDGYSELDDAGKFDDVIKRLNSFRLYIADASIKKQIKTSKDIHDKANFEIKKIISILEKLYDK